MAKYIPKHQKSRFAEVNRPIYATKVIDWTKYHYVKIDERTWVLRLKTKE